MLVTAAFYNLGFIHLSAFPARRFFLFASSHYRLDLHSTHSSPLDVSNQQLLKFQSRLGTEFSGAQAQHGTMIDIGPHHYAVPGLGYYLSYLPLGFVITLTGIT